MKKETIVNKLLGITDKMDKQDWKFKDTEVRKDVQSLIEELQKEIYFEDKGFKTNDKKATNKALSVLKQLKKDNDKCTYATTKIENGYQTLLNGFWAVALKEVNGLLPIDNNRNVDVLQLFKEFDSKDIVELELDFDDLFRKLKAKSLETNGSKVYRGMMKNGEDDICFNADFMKTIVTIMGSDIQNLKVYGKKNPYASWYHILIVDTVNGNLGYLLPIRIRK